MSRQYRDADSVSNDRNEIYDRRDTKKKRREWRDKRHQENRNSSTTESDGLKPTTRDFYEDDDEEY